MPRKLPNLKNHKGDFLLRTDLRTNPETYSKFEKLISWCKRESLTLQEGMTQFIFEGVDRHYYGNSQTLLDSYEPAGIKSDGQIEQIITNKLFKKYQTTKQPIPRIDIVTESRDIGIDPKKIPEATNRVIQNLRELEVPITH